MIGPINVSAQCFGELQARTGAPIIQLTVSAPHTCAELIDSARTDYPGAADVLARTACARGDTLLAADTPLIDGDEIALIPPVSGGQPDESAYLTDAPLDLDVLLAETQNMQSGAVVVFGGTVRIANNDRAVEAIDYTAYAPLAAKSLAEIEAQTIAKYAAHACRIQHRTGRLGLGETSVYVVVRARHRDQAFDAARYAIETLKQRAAIWKNEHYSDGDSQYLEGNAVITGPDDHGHSRR